MPPILQHRRRVPSRPLHKRSHQLDTPLCTPSALLDGPLRTLSRLDPDFHAPSLLLLTSTEPHMRPPLTGLTTAATANLGHQPESLYPLRLTRLLRHSMQCLEPLHLAQGANLRQAQTPTYLATVLARFHRTFEMSTVLDLRAVADLNTALPPSLEAKVTTALATRLSVRFLPSVVVKNKSFHVGHGKKL
jgi:hypothetical protein